MASDVGSAGNTFRCPYLVTNNFFSHVRNPVQFENMCVKMSGLEEYMI
jgi:hypothetical protein